MWKRKGAVKNSEGKGRLSLEEPTRRASQEESRLLCRVVTSLSPEYAERCGMPSLVGRGGGERSNGHSFLPFYMCKINKLYII